MTTKTKKQTKSTSIFDYKTIKSFEDACAKLELDPAQLPEIPLVELSKPLIAAFKLMIIFMAINNGWKPDWSNSYQWKYYAWFSVLPSGLGFSYSTYGCTRTAMSVGSRLCTDTSEKAQYIADQFKEIYKDYLLYTE